MKIVISPKYVLHRLISIVVALLLVNILVSFIRFHTSNPYLIGFAKLFDFNTETNIPTLFSVCILLLCAILLYGIQNAAKHTHDTLRWYWLLLCLTFFFLALDEFGSLHERLMPLVDETFDLPRFLKYSWIIPYSVVLLLAVIPAYRFLGNIPKPSRNRFLISAAIYLSGALGMELLGSYQDSGFGTRNFGYIMLYTTEEFLEMIGICCFVYSLLKHLISYSLNDLPIKIVKNVGASGAGENEVVISILK